MASCFDLHTKTQCRPVLPSLGSEQPPSRRGVCGHTGGTAVSGPGVTSVHPTEPSVLTESFTGSKRAGPSSREYMNQEEGPTGRVLTCGLVSWAPQRESHDAFAGGHRVPSHEAFRRTFHLAVVPTEAKWGHQTRSVDVPLVRRPFP